MKPAATQGRFGGQQGVFKCRVPGCHNKEPHYWPDCLAYRALTVEERWALVKAQQMCQLCVKHVKDAPLGCMLAKQPGGQSPCGESGCTQYHHPTLHVQRDGWLGIQATRFTFLINTEDNHEDAVQEDLMDKQEDLMDKQEANMDNQQDSEANPSGRDSMINGEIIPFSGLSCTVKKEAAEENKNEKDEFNTTNPGSKEINVPGGAVALDSAEKYPVSTVLTENDEKKGLKNAVNGKIVINLCHTVANGSSLLNVAYDTGSSFTMITEDAARLGIQTELENMALMPCRGRES
jgi:hypothetical protein